MRRFAAALAATMLAVSPLAPASGWAAQPASPATVKAQDDLKASLPFSDRQDFDFASRGFLGTRKDPVIRDAKGEVVWDLSVYDFLKGEAPATVNPSLWRQAQLLSMSGLFQVSDNIWQVRGFDLANITFVKGETGWIVIDPLTTNEAAKAAYDLVTEKLGQRPVVAVIYTHSHADHFGGARGIVSQADYDSGKVRVIGPAGFLEEAVSENVIAGPAMNRRAVYQFGYDLVPGPQGQISSGIGQALSKGTISLLPPKESIDHTGQVLDVDGVKIEFQVTPGTEAPAEMNFYFPDWKVLCMAENANATMHNILTPRGAKVRDAKAWADYLSESIRLFGDRTDVMFTSHGWPRFGQQTIVSYLSDHRDAYKYLHDQTVRLMNSGMLPAEIANALTLPPALAKDWFNRGYYGTMSFNSRAVYQAYMGWYDGNPVNLSILPPAEQGKRYVEAMGGADKVIALAQAAYDKGDYGWAATLLNNVVMADAGNAKAKKLLADSYEQLGYQSESSIWRNMYLAGTSELRDGIRPAPPTTGSADIIANLPSEAIFDLMATRLDPAKVGDARVSVLFIFPERNERFLVSVHNDVLTAEPAAEDAKADATLTVARALFLQSLFTGQSLAPKVLTGQVKVAGDIKALQKLTSWFDQPKPGFPIVTR